MAKLEELNNQLLLSHWFFCIWYKQLPIFWLCLLQVNKLLKSFLYLVINFTWKSNSKYLLSISFGTCIYLHNTTTTWTLYVLPCAQMLSYCQLFGDSHGFCGPPGSSLCMGFSGIFQPRMNSDLLHALLAFGVLLLTPSDPYIYIYIYNIMHILLSNYICIYKWV